MLFGRPTEGLHACLREKDERIGELEQRGARLEELLSTAAASK